MDIVNITEGKLLVVPSLRGNWRAYWAVMRTYEEMKAAKAADYLVMPGNLIHAGQEDGSLKILDDLIERNDESVVSLLGARELAHIYHFEMRAVGLTTIEVDRQEKRALEIIPVVQRLEDQIEQLGLSRDKYVNFMKAMPYAITTASVMVNSAGENRPMGGFAEPEYVGICMFTGSRQAIEGINHDILLDYFKGRAREDFEAETGNLLAKDFFEGFTPLIGKAFRKSDLGQYLLAVFAPQARQDLQRETIQADFLQGMGQQFLVSANPQVVRRQKLRNGIMLQPFSTQEYEFAALIDAGRTYSSVDELEKEMQLIKVG